jgi:hypothetical protein
VPDPVVDMGCVERAKHGTLTTDLPGDEAGFTVTASKDGAHLHHDGRKLDDADGARLWQTLQNKVFGAGGLASGSSGMYSVYRCDDVAPASCIKMQEWVCEVGLDTLATRVRDAVAELGLTDAELSLDIQFLEARGPSCKLGAACVPPPHYSGKDKRYDPHQSRTSLHQGRGACTNDGDCEGADSNNCKAWYLVGGGENLLYVQYSETPFCGCVEQRCSWFTQ